MNVIVNNLTRIKSLTGGKLLFMVKADAYGHGMERVAQATEDAVDMFGVATADEGKTLRESGIKKDILVAVCPPEELENAVNLGLTAAIADCGSLAALTELGKRRSDVRFQIKLDTGMHRLGFEEDELDCVLETLKKNGLTPSGVYSHLRDVDEKQIAAFKRMSEKTQAAFPQVMRHLASSHSLERKDILFDMVRVGLYGYTGAMSVASKVLSVRRVNAGEHVCYGDFTFDKPTNIAVVFGGYADGVRRENPSPVEIGGHILKVVGNVCMDMFAVDCGEFMPRAGDEVILQGGNLTAQNLAFERNTVEYTVLTAWRGRAERIYSDVKSGSKENCESRNP